LQALIAGAAVAGSGGAWAQVQVGSASGLRKLIPADDLEQAAGQQYQELLQKAKSEGALAGANNPQLQRLRTIAQRIIPYTTQWNPRAAQWRWEVNLIGSKEVNAFCMPGGKIAFYTAILEKLQLNDDEVAMVMGHEMAHALREHSREQMAKNSATNIGLSLGAQLLGLGDLGNLAAKMGSQLLSLRFSRSDESEADLVGLELAARAGYNPQAGVTLWRKMGEATGDGGIGFLSTHPTGPDRIRELERNIPRVQGLYEASRKR
jgi:Zn-dependent protease with chaperone function